MSGYYIRFGFLRIYSCGESLVFDHFNKFFMNDNDIFVDCILNFAIQSFFYQFAMFLSFITFIHHHSLFLGFAIFKYIVQTITNCMIYAYPYYFCLATSLPKCQITSSSKFESSSTMSNTRFNIFRSQNLASSQYKGTRCRVNGSGYRNQAMMFFIIAIFQTMHFRSSFFLL